MKDKTTSFKRTINYIFTFSAILILVASLALAFYDYKLEQEAINIKATITALNYEDGKYEATVKYDANGETFRQNIILKSNKYAVNEEVPIKYSMNNPGELIYNNHYNIYLPSLIISLIILLFTFNKTRKNLKRSSNISKLKEKGIFIYANISEVFIDNKKGKSNGKFPYKLRCKYINPADNKEYVFESEPSFLDFNEIFSRYNNQTIIVYIDKKNTSNYYVDLDSLLPHIELVDVGEVMGEKQNNQQDEETSSESKTEGETETDGEKKDNSNTTDSKEEKAK